MQIHIYKNEVQEGPFEINEINQRIQNGEIDPHTTLGWVENSTDWIPLSQFSEINVQKSASAPPPPPPNNSGTGNQLELWNPNAAANWSLVFTPVFGGIIHYLNWQKIGDSSKARVSLIWVGVVTVILILNAVVEANLQFLFLVVLFAWYFSMARKQVNFVKENLPGYKKKSWRMPLRNAVGAMIAYTLVIFASINFFQGDLPAVDSPEVIELVEQILTDSPEGKLTGAIFGDMKIEMPAETGYDRKAQKRTARAMLKTANMGTVPIYYTVEWHNKKKEEIWVEILE